MHALRGTFGVPCAERLRSLDADARERLARGREQGLSLAVATAHAQLAAARGADDEIDAALRHRNSALSFLARGHDAPDAERLEPLLWIGVVDWAVLGDVRGARDRLARAAVLARSDQQASVVIPTLAIRSMASAVAGDLAGADATVREAVALARDGDDPLLLAVALATLARRRSNDSERDAALQAGEELLALRSQVDDPAALDAIAAWGVAAVRLEAGDLAGCRALIEPATAPEQLRQLHPLVRSLLLDTRIRLAVGRDDRTDALAQLTALERLGFSRQPLGASLAGMASAFVALADDRPLNAEASATAAADQARRASARLLELRALLVAGRAQQALGAPDVAAERFGEAEAMARAIGAAGTAERAAAERRASGGMIAERPAPEEYGLTPRQFEIAQLVAGGATNREVAAILGISEHTVNTHLRVAFSRLGVTRRTALATALEQRQRA
ncbi:helix-turn-helix transcriptional regulator [Conexibacter sp. JD483]|uniref:helix-turn-helix domain-containing protein n=1 Tax=unclassified Conexibacter TaxID=2627773 RepID=UPI002727AEB2|nr:MULTISPECIES: helix-turn-helix transcriptional regulator [unclassified Conexibacter]MDO8186800.1 helix-turn-helix transcriptional regulator [Conexibacter sp. CPCC 205706]MDO8197446.1 helix-turn-helix transcriptional regulator [Conexibacter sp. CPCC 205762]MDR9370461.1 helix-turn-helix transcriptional regulator [Conexibacter sp. JD483]